MPTGLLYTRDHEYVRVLADGVALVGIGPYAVEALGNIVSVTLPTAGIAVRAGESVAAFETAKAVCEVFAPVSGVVTAVNEQLLTHPDLATSDPTGAGWFFQLTFGRTEELKELLDAEAYALYVEASR